MCVCVRVSVLKMICRNAIILISTAILLIGSNAKPFTDKNRQSVFDIKHPQKFDYREDQINDETNTIPNHLIPSSIKERNIQNDWPQQLNGYHFNRIARMIKSLRAVQDMNDNTDSPKTVQLRREKRNSRSEKMTHGETKLVDDMDRFNKNDDQDVDDYFNDEKLIQRSKTKQHKQPLEDQPSKPPNYMESDDYNGYAFDTIDNDQFNEDDELLSRYYSHPTSRRHAFDNYDSFAEIMHAAAGESEDDNRFVKRLHYGDANNFLNDGIDDDDLYDENESNKGFDDDYASYEDY